MAKKRKKKVDDIPPSWMEDTAETIEAVSDDLANEIPSDSRLAEVRVLIAKQDQLERDIEDKEEELRLMVEEYEDVAVRDLPAALEQLGFSELSTEDGTGIYIKDITTAKIPKDRTKAAFTWLKQFGHGAIIKHHVGLSFTKGEDKQAKTAAAALKMAGFKPTDEQTVHYQTLNAWVKEQLAEGVDIPLDLFGVFTVKRAEIQRPDGQKFRRKYSRK